jgi:hypothetical protein
VRKKRAKNVYHPTIKSKLSDRKRECMCRYLKTDHAHWVSLLLLLLVVVAVALLLPPAPPPPIMDVMAAASATVKLGSAVMALTVSANVGPMILLSVGSMWASDDICRPENLDWLYGGTAKAGAVPPPGRGTWDCGGGGPLVRSSVTVGKGAEAEMVAMLEEQGSTVRARKFEATLPSALGMDPASSMEAAAEVVEAMATAAGGRGWLWVPSYVVMRMDRSSAHRWTCMAGFSRRSEMVCYQSITSSNKARRKIIFDDPGRNSSTCFRTGHPLAMVHR